METIARIRRTTLLLAALIIPTLAAAQTAVIITDPVTQDAARVIMGELQTAGGGGGGGTVDQGAAGMDPWAVEFLSPQSVVGTNTTEATALAHRCVNPIGTAFQECGTNSFLESAITFLTGAAFIPGMGGLPTMGLMSGGSDGANGQFLRTDTTGRLILGAGANVIGAVTQSGTWNVGTVTTLPAITFPAQSTVTGSLSAAGSTVTMTVPAGTSTISLYATGNTTMDEGFITEQTIDGTNWEPIAYRRVDLTTGEVDGFGFYANMAFDGSELPLSFWFNVAGAQQLRVRNGSSNPLTTPIDVTFRAHPNTQGDVAVRGPSLSAIQTSTAAIDQSILALFTSGLPIRDSSTFDPAAVINAAPTTQYGLVTRNIPSGTQPVSGTVTIGTFPDNEPVNVAQFGGSAVVTGVGAAGAGVPRVTASLDAVTYNGPTAVSVDGASEQVLAANASRKFAQFINTSANTISCAVGAAAVLNSGVTILPGGSWFMGREMLGTGAVNCIAGAAASNLSVQEGQ